MEPSTPRPSTHPPSTPSQTGLLTPPSTGGSRKRVMFVEPQESQHTSKRQNRSQTREGETLSEFFEDYNEGEDAQIDHESTTGSSQSGDSSTLSEGECLADGSATTETSSIFNGNTFVDHIGESVSAPKLLPVSPVGPFPFLKLPLSIRNKVYEHLLVIPAIICVRQKHTSFHDERKAYLYAERRELLPGIAYALAQTKVDGFKNRFSRFRDINLNVLRTSKAIFTEARAVMYSQNDFEIIKPTDELTPQPDFDVPLFPPGYQRIVAKLNIRIRTFYDLHWILSGGYNVMRNYYGGLATLTLILEIDTATKGFGRQWARKKNENWVTYIKQMQGELAEDLFNGAGSDHKTIPTCINLRVLFSGETYTGNSDATTDLIGLAVTEGMRVEHAKREELRSALFETWELFKKGGR